MFIRVLSLFLVLLVAGLARDVSDDRKTDGMMIGGLTPTKPANRQIQNMVEQVRSSFETKLGSSSVVFIADSYRQQLVNGMNFFVKVKVDTTEYAHLRIYQALGSEQYSLEGYQLEKTLDDPIEYF